MNYEQYDRLRRLKFTFGEHAAGSAFDYYGYADEEYNNTYQRIYELYARRVDSARQKLDRDGMQALLQEHLDSKTTENKRQLAGIVAERTGITPHQVGESYTSKMGIEYLERISATRAVIEDGCDKLPDDDVCAKCTSYITPLCVTLNDIIN